MLKIIPNDVEVKEVKTDSDRVYEVAVMNPSRFTGYFKTKTDGANKPVLEVALRLEGVNVYKVVIHEEDFVTKYKKDFVRMVKDIIKEYESEVYYDNYKKFLEWDGKL